MRYQPDGSHVLYQIATLISRRLELQIERFWFVVSKEDWEKDVCWNNIECHHIHYSSKQSVHVTWEIDVQEWQMSHQLESIKHQNELLHGVLKQQIEEKVSNSDRLRSKLDSVLTCFQCRCLSSLWNLFWDEDWYFSLISYTKSILVLVLLNEELNFEFIWSWYGWDVKRIVEDENEYKQGLCASRILFCKNRPSYKNLRL